MERGMNRHARRAAEASKRRDPRWSLANLKAEIESAPEGRAAFSQDADGFNRELRETINGLSERGVMKTTLAPDDDQTADDDAYVTEFDGVDVEVSGVLVEALDAIAADPRLAMEVIGEIASMTRWRGDPEECDETRHDLAAIIAEAMGRRRHEEAARQEADISALHQLGRYMLSEIDRSGDDAGLYVLIAGIAGLIADYLVEQSELIWTFGTTDEVLISMSVDGDGAAPNLAPGALDRARTTMRDAGWLSWMVDGDGFIYTLTPPENWRELVEVNETAIAADESVT
jgi:hypothetical protein